MMQGTLTRKCQPNGNMGDAASDSETGLAQAGKHAHSDCDTRSRPSLSAARSRWGSARRPSSAATAAATWDSSARHAHKHPHTAHTRTKHTHTRTSTQAHTGAPAPPLNYLPTPLPPSHPPCRPLCLPPTQAQTPPPHHRTTITTITTAVRMQARTHPGAGLALLLQSLGERHQGVRGSLPHQHLQVRHEVVHTVVQCRKRGCGVVRARPILESNRGVEPPRKGATNHTRVISRWSTHAQTACQWTVRVMAEHCANTDDRNDLLPPPPHTHPSTPTPQTNTPPNPTPPHPTQGKKELTSTPPVSPRPTLRI